MLRLAPVGFAFARPPRRALRCALLAGALSCGPPEVQACEDFVAALRECTDRNGPASGPGEDHEACEAAQPACETYFRCAAAAACVEDEADGYFTLDLAGCEAPEDVDCP